MTPPIPGGGEPHLFCFGLGFTALTLCERLMREGWRISGTCRTAKKRRSLAATGIRVHLFDRGRPLDDAVDALTGVTDVLSSVPPDGDGDSVLDHHSDDLIAAHGVRWFGYLSTTGVYGDTGGTEVDEHAPLVPTTERSRRRVAAEQRWLALHETHALPIHLFRLAGIYGPGRSTFDQIRAGRARRIDRPGHLFSRIHVEDIAMVLRASMARPAPGSIYNVCDDEPAEPSDVVTYACRLLDVEPPAKVPFEQAAAEMSQMAQTFWRDNRRVSNKRVKEVLRVVLKYPDYRSGLKAVLEAEQQAQSP